MRERMKIVSYNVNGLRQRIAQFGSLRNLLNSFDADIICFQVLSQFIVFSFYSQFLILFTTVFPSGDETAEAGSHSGFGHGRRIRIVLFLHPHLPEGSNWLFR